MVVQWLKAFIGSCGPYKDMCWFSHESEAFNLYTTQFVKKQ